MVSSDTVPYFYKTVEGCSSPFLGTEPVGGQIIEVCRPNAWPVLCQTSGHLSNRMALLPIDWYQLYCLFMGYTRV